MNDTETGRFITFEGGEGAGKSTQVSRLAAALGSAGKTVVSTREPGGSEAAEEIRRLLVSGAVDRWQPDTEALLHNAARVEHVAGVVRPALGAGKWVISDRFHDSTLAYQGYGHGLDPDRVAALHALIFGDFRPDLTLILDLPVADGLARTQGRDGAEDRYERMSRDFHERLREGFLAIARAEPDRCVVIDATADEDSVHARVLAVVEERLRAGLD
ncbi:MAG: dTMP kinase [Magnetovibrio sp.]|nr:dTMP kinase [Magnetovibrio sp.]